MPKNEILEFTKSHGLSFHEMGGSYAIKNPRNGMIAGSPLGYPGWVVIRRHRNIESTVAFRTFGEAMDFIMWGEIPRKW